jgi:predicted site-specific integrase-resolvase
VAKAVKVLLRQSEAAHELSVSEGTVRNWMRREQRQAGSGLRFITLPSGERRIPASEIDRILGGVA